MGTTHRQLRCLAMALCLVSMTACSQIWHRAYWHRAKSQATVARAQPTNPPNSRFLAQGYLLGVDRGQWVYCRREIPTGSRLPQNSCVSEEKLLQVEQDSRDILDAARHVPVPTSPCGFMGCGGGSGGSGGGGGGSPRP